jgi:lipoyl(octanoyl) transferase
MSTSWTPTSSPSSPKAEAESAGAPAAPADGATGPGLQPGAWRWLGRVPFGDTAILQERLRTEIREGRRGDTLLLLEHDPVITLGRSAASANVLHSEAALAARGITLHKASRGGDVTYHGPGQLVGYPVIRLRSGVRAFVEGMAAALIEVLAECGVSAYYRNDAPGLWVRLPDGRESGLAAQAKICAFGINVHHRVSIHGFALNLRPALEAFGLIVPCGLSGCAVTSLESLRGSAPEPSALAPRVARALGAHLGIAFTPEHGEETESENQPAPVADQDCNA